MSKIITNNEAVFCDFCGKHADFVKYILAGPINTHVCNECISAADKMITEMETIEKVNNENG